MRARCSQIADLLIPHPEDQLEGHEFLPRLGRGVEPFRQLQQLAKLLHREACIADDSAKRERVDGVMPGNGEDAGAIGHDNVFPLACDNKPGLFKGAHGIQVVDSGDLWQAYTATSTSRTSSPRSCSSITAR